ncbi:hypothetical protein KAR91_31870 [Candidatus Pacearchaeota archaeon]|nr:hypothetical protein [Candidatus Pacearchaeota archaeon]
MAIRPDVELAPNITAATASFPLGSSKNETAPATNDGTPHNLTRANDIFGFQQALLKAANIVASGNPDTALDENSSQYLQAILHQVLSGFVFDDSGAADAYVLSVVGNNPAPADYEDNMTFRFVATNTNTGASTVDVESLGVKNIFLDGAALTGGEIITGNAATITFDVANDRFNIIPGTSLLQLRTEIATTSGTVIDFTGITPSAKKITFMLNGVSTNGTSAIIIQIGDSGGFEISGYLGATAVIIGTPIPASFSSGYALNEASTSSDVIYGPVTLTLMNPSTNGWIIGGSIGNTAGPEVYALGGFKALSGPLTQIRLTTVNGTDAFDAGAANILVER